jgi:hypothetical protein
MERASYALASFGGFRSMNWRRFVIPCFLAVPAIIACGSGSTASAPADPLAQCTIQVQRFKELSIVDEAVMNDDRASNAKDGVWSFRYALEQIMGGSDPSEYILAWTENWADTTQVNGFPTDVESRASGIHDFLVCPWLRRTPSNNCDASCSACAAKKLDLAQAPFRLLAIVNRLDVQGNPAANVTSPVGEARLVFGLTDGAADDPASPARAMTLIFEYSLPTTHSASDWANLWHHLGTYATFDDAYKADLESITNQYVHGGTAPNRPNGSWLAQARTNESVFNWIWQLRQFNLDAGGNLRLAPMVNTPGEPLNGSTQLSDWVTANADAIKKDKFVLPPSMLGGAADQFRYRWNLPGVDEVTRGAFARGTCNGCHSGENPPIDTAFHVSPFRKGIDKLSPFVNDPADPTHDDLANREIVMKDYLCGVTK